MTQDTAQKAAKLLSSIRNLEFVIEDLKNERAAKGTGLDFRCPGPQHHVLETINRRWNVLGEWCVDFFITAMDTVIRNAEVELSDLRKQLEDL